MLLGNFTVKYEVAEVSEGAEELTHSQTKLLAEVIKLTEDMFSLARASDWDGVAELELIRRNALGRCFDRPILDHDSSLIAEALAVILHLNEELMSVLTIAREQTQEEGLIYRKGRAAVTQYQDVDAS